MTILKCPCDDCGERRRKAVRDYFHENKARLELEKAKKHLDTCFILSDRLKEKPR